MALVSLAERLAYALKQRDWSMYKLAQEAELDPGYVGKMVAGEKGKNASAKTIRKLARALCVQEDWLAHGEGPMEAPADRVVEKDDRYPTRPIAADIARRGGMPEEAIAPVMAMELDAEEDPGALYWLEQMQAQRTLLRGKALPATKLRVEDFPAPRGPRKRTGT